MNAQTSNFTNTNNKEQIHVKKNPDDKTSIVACIMPSQSEKHPLITKFETIAGSNKRYSEGTINRAFKAAFKEAFTTDHVPYEIDRLYTNYVCAMVRGDRDFYWKARVDFQPEAPELQKKWKQYLKRFDKS